MIATTVRRTDIGYLLAIALTIAMTFALIITVQRTPPATAPDPDVIIAPHAPAVDVNASLWGLAAVEARPLTLAEPIVVPATVPLELGGPMAGVATHYGAELYQGRGMACGGTYETSDPTIVAVGPALDAAAPCGTAIRVCGVAGCIDGRRTDSGLGAGVWVDLSEAGIIAVCGALDRCDVTVEIER